MTNDPLSLKSGVRIAVPARDLPKRRKRLGLQVFLGIAAALLAIVGLMIFVYRDTLVLLIYPERIEICMFEETEAVLRELELKGSIRNVRIDNDGEQTLFSFRSSDGSVEVDAQYIGNEFFSMEGRINALQSSIQTIAQAEEFAAAMLSPFFDTNEARAVILKFSPDIIAQAGMDEMDMKLILGERYTAAISGQPMGVVQFTIEQL